MKKYKSHKIVQAEKIVSIAIMREEKFSVDLYFDIGGIEVTREWYKKHEPHSGGYYVVYEDGYASFSPADVFESGYTEITEANKTDYVDMEGNTIEVHLSFSTALHELKEGNRVSRLGWNGKGQYLTLQTPTETSKMTLPYIFIATVDGNLVPWVCSQTDMLVEDWYVC